MNEIESYTDLARGDLDALKKETEKLVFLFTSTFNIVNKIYQQESIVKVGINSAVKGILQLFDQVNAYVKAILELLIGLQEKYAEAFSLLHRIRTRTNESKLQLRNSKKKDIEMENLGGVLQKLLNDDIGIDGIIDRNIIKEDNAGSEENNETPSVKNKFLSFKKDFEDLINNIIKALNDRSKISFNDLEFNVSIQNAFASLIDPLKLDLKSISHRLENVANQEVSDLISQLSFPVDEEAITNVVEEYGLGSMLSNIKGIFIFSSTMQVKYI